VEVRILETLNSRVIAPGDALKLRARRVFEVTLPFSSHVCT
jgi:hypothetical protein